MTAATQTLKGRLRRIGPYFAGTRRGFVLVVIGAIVSALTEPAIPALLKPLLDSGFNKSGMLTLWLVPVAIVGLFFIRGVWMMRDSKLLQHRLVKTAPHVVDTVLLASAIMLAAMTRQYPLDASWLTAKVIALVIYIVLGMIALKHWVGRGARVCAWLCAQLVFGYIVLVALTRSPVGPFQ